MASTDRDLLLPARDTRGAARRLVLLVHIDDGRRARRFMATDHVARLRLRVIDDRVFAAVSAPSRSEKRESERLGVELLTALRASVGARLIPANRDTLSGRFEETLSAALRARLEERALHGRRGGAPSEYRAIKAALLKISEVGDALIGPLWPEIHRGLVPGLAVLGDFTIDASPQSLVDWLTTRVRFRISTGAHDEKMVAPAEVGSGLQSLLDLAIQQASEPSEGVQQRWLLVEEPEAFLHPSAQRALAVDLVGDTQEYKLITTHSPAVVDEAEYGQVVLVRDHRVFEPRVTDERRQAINSALQTGSGSEALFARSVLLVEGPGDRVFFEALRRRLARHDELGFANSLAVIAAGGKTRFGPWVTLFRSYVDEATGELPIRFHLVADACDAIGDVRAGLRAGGIQLTALVVGAMDRAIQAYGSDDEAAAISATGTMNRQASRSGIPCSFLPFDLEYAIVERLSDDTLVNVSALVSDQALTKEALMARLGSKAGRGPIAAPNKADWVRAQTGWMVPWEELSPAVTRVMRRWFLNAGMTERQWQHLQRRVRDPR